MFADNKSKAEAKQASRKRKTPMQEEQEAAADPEAAETSAKKGRAPKAEAYKLPEVGSSLLSSSVCSLVFQQLPTFWGASHAKREKQAST